MTTIGTVKAIVGALTLSASATSAQASVLINGGFEQPPIADSCCNTVSAPGTIPGWQVVSGDVNVVNGTFGSGGPNLAAQGRQYLDLIGESGAGSIRQTFNTIAGRTYDLSFAYSHNVFSAGSAAASFGVGNLSGSVTHSTGSGTNLDWRTYANTFVAGAGSTSTLTFLNTGGSTDGGTFLDGVSVSLVPEPATWGMMIMGFGVAGAALRRRNRARLAFA